MRFITNVSSERSCFAPCAGCVLPVTYRRCDGQPNRSSKPYSVLRDNRQSSAGRDILSVDEDNLARHGDYLHLMSGDMGAIIQKLSYYPPGSAPAAVTAAKPRFS